LQKLRRENRVIEKRIGNIRDVYILGELKGYACLIGGTFFDELCLIMKGFERGPPAEKQRSLHRG